jgi:LysM repeat protein
VYTVQYGDTLFSIARRFGTSVENILYANSIRNIHYIRAGQTLVIPHCRQPAECVVYTVQRGDTLFSIARRHSTSPRAIALQNRIVYPWRIFAGQQILICPGGGLPLPEARTYVVRPGDTIWSIAFRFGTSPYAVIAANNLQYPGLIFPGQELRIP